MIEFQPIRPLLTSTVQRAKFALWLWCAVSGLLGCGGCTRNPYMPGGGPWGAGQYPPGGGMPGYAAGGQAPLAGPQSVFAGQQTSPQLVEFQQRVQQLDDNNRQLTAQLAQAQQQLQAFRERGDLLAKQ